MPRSGAGARARLQQAALELYTERGYEGTTTSDIAERAGLNHRTFFRHFADKREVLFHGQDDLRASLVHAVSEAPPGQPAVQVLLAAFLASTHVLEANEALAAPRLHLIAATPPLQERDLAKGAAMAQALAAALQERGEPSEIAHLLATVGWATFHHAASSWITHPDSPLEHHLRHAFDVLATSIVAISVR